MASINAKEIENYFSYKQMQDYIKKLRSNYNALQLENNHLRINQEGHIKKEVKIRTKILEDKVKNIEIEKDKIITKKEKIILEKDKEIEVLKSKIAHMQTLLDNDASNSGVPTSKTAIGRKKFIPNSREKSEKKKGAQPGHKKNKLKPFPKEEATEVVEYLPTECPKCHNTNLEIMSTGVDKQELDYEVIVVKRINHFPNCKCKECNHEFHANIPNELKEEIQYGSMIQSLAVCLTNDIYTPFNKTVQLIKGLTAGEISPSEGYITKLQKRASSYLEDFIEDAKEHVRNSLVFGWDDGVVTLNQKEAILRTYCTNEVALFFGHEKKDEASLEKDGILSKTREGAFVMHDHLLHNYNDKYQFENVECLAHLLRRLMKMEKQTKHDWNDDLKKLLSQTNKDRNQYFKENKESFEKEYLEKLSESYDSILEKAKLQNEKDPDTVNYYKTEELRFINDLTKYKKNYLNWAYHFFLPSTNNACERNIRPVKSKMKISGQFQSIEYVKYYATIRSYIETCKRHGINIIEACVKLMTDNPYTLSEILSQKMTSK